MKRYRFYIAWVNGSDGACGEETKISRLEDLKPQYEAGNEYVNNWEYDAPEGFEWEVGAARAFMANFTAIDTVSYVEEI